jgi:hypothetical protein
METTPQGVPVPVRLGTGTERMTESELEDICCYCGRRNLEGIYRREEPQKVPCGGHHPKDVMQAATQEQR